MGDGGALAAGSASPAVRRRRRAIPDRNCSASIVVMARTSTPWRLLPVQELGCGLPATVWRRLNQWVTAGRLGVQAELLITRLVLVMLTVERGDVGAFPAARQPTDRP
jgi:hypothetical protein